MPVTASEFERRLLSRCEGDLDMTCQGPSEGYDTPHNAHSVHIGHVQLLNSKFLSLLEARLWVEKPAGTGQTQAWVHRSSRQPLPSPTSLGEWVALQSSSV